MEEKNIVVGLVIGLFILFHLLKALNADKPVRISKDDYKTLEQLRYLEHEKWVSSLTNERFVMPGYNKEELLAKLPLEYHKYIDTQDYINGTKVVRIQFDVQ